MKIGFLKETLTGENRVSASPNVVKLYISKGYEVLVEGQAGELSGFTDDDYKSFGAQIESKNVVLAQSDVLVSVHALTASELALAKEGATFISSAQIQTQRQFLEAMGGKKQSYFCLDLIPRTTKAQSMDILSSQANLAGYKAVIMGANAMGKIFPMMTTAAGTIKPSKVVIFGAGVAGLQAIATAKRLGAVVEVSDIRPETKEQVMSLGGKFIEVETDDSIKTEGGYVKNVSEEFLKKQQDIVGQKVALADLVITTALVQGRKPPLLVSEDMVKSMKSGSVIVDMAAMQGGNCALTEAGKTVMKYGVTIVGETGFASSVALNASELFARNVYEFITHLSNKEAMSWDMEDEITKGSLVVHNGLLVHDFVKKILV